MGEYWDGFVADHAIEIKTHDDRHRPLIEIDMLQVSPGRHTNWPGLQVQTLMRVLDGRQLTEGV